MDSFLNPPTTSRGSNVILKISNNEELILTKRSNEDNFVAPPRTVYDLRIPNPLSIGFTTAQRSEFAEEFKGLTLALNLSLYRSCVTETNIVFNSPTLQFKPMKLRNEVRKIGNRIHAFAENAVIVSDHSFAYVSLSDDR